MDNTYFIGTITSTHKLTGTIKLHTSFPIIEELKGFTVIAKNKDDVKLLTISNIKGLNGKKILLDFNEINNIDEAKKIVNYDLYIRKDLIPDYYEEESIISYKVYNKDEYIGLVTDIMDNTVYDILIVKNEDKEKLIPYIDVFVKEVDDDNKKIIVELIEGM